MDRIVPSCARIERMGGSGGGGGERDCGVEFDPRSFGSEGVMAAK